MINKKTQKIFWFLWRNRKEPYTIRETSQETGVSYGSTWSILKEFEELGIVYVIEKKKAYLYMLNFEHSLCFHVWSLLNALRREDLDIDATVKEKVKQLEEGFIVQYSTNGISKVICCSEKRIEGLESTDPENLKLLLHEKDLYDTLWSEGIVLGGERRFYTFMWEIAEKRVIGVGA